jgi:hypothetical protein
MSSVHMSEPHSNSGGSGGIVAPGAAGWLGVAAAPTFAIMALSTGVSSGPSAMLCMGHDSALSLSGMPAMYTLMSLFHAGPWLKLIFNQGTCRT